MDELTLMLEGIQHKVKRLMVVNKSLREQINSLQNERNALSEQLESQKQNNEQLKEDMLHLRAAKSLGGEDSLMAKQKVNELLREIDKCYKLINSQVK